MRIGIDGCTWANRRGYGRFTRMLVTTMMTEYPDHAFTLVLDQHTVTESELPEGVQVEIVKIDKQPIRAASAYGSRSAKDLWKMSRAVSRRDFDVFLFPTSYSFYPLFCKTPTVVVFHDAIAEQHPDLIFPRLRSRLLWKLKSWLAMRRADRVVTVSQSARAQLAAVFRRPLNTIDVITEGPAPCFQPLDVRQSAATVLSRYGLPDKTPLILYVGGISPHKNLERLLRAAKRLTQPWHLVLVGDCSNDSFFSSYQEVLELSRDLDLVERVTFTGYVPDTDLVLFYNLATLLVLPSLGEGFGLPVVEAMACGLSVAASNRGSLPEVIGEAGLLFDPCSEEEIAGAMARLLGDESLRREISGKARERAKLFSWKNGARKMMSILEEAAGAG